jgi:hypothetical protein
VKFSQPDLFCTSQSPGIQQRSQPPILIFRLVACPHRPVNALEGIWPDRIEGDSQQIGSSAPDRQLSGHQGLERRSLTIVLRKPPPEPCTPLAKPSTGTQSPRFEGSCFPERGLLFTNSTRRQRFGEHTASMVLALASKRLEPRIDDLDHGSTHQMGHLLRGKLRLAVVTS